VLWDQHRVSALTRTASESDCEKHDRQIRDTDFSSHASVV
jgi:hypothetical protein